jgi:hypothetical protein
MSFNENNDNQSLLFTPVEHIKRNHYDVITKVANTPAVHKMVTMTPYQAQPGNSPRLAQDKVTGTSAAATSEMAYAVSKGRERVADAEEIAEPVKRESKKAEVAVPAAKANLDAVLAAWGGEE